MITWLYEVFKGIIHSYLVFLTPKHKTEAAETAFGTLPPPLKKKNLILKKLIAAKLYI